ncbi:MAG: hypothetical protein L6R38_001801 [Xanthoria sp. 2 TBL-2021]|nr:MAG: hypothetical protein L6R38_001801 [Xanthoria sp. 2 TBL-2021]
MIRPSLVRSSVLRMVRPQVIQQRRTFSTPNSILRGDLVQDLYLREIRAYKPPPLKPSDSDGHVQKFSAPKAPQSPDEGDIAQDLKAYENQQVELEGQAASGESGAAEESWFEEEEDDEEHAAAPH